VPTLYELLEALPEDDADGLRAAFRKAVKAHHPDNNPDDPDAAQRFRRVVRAHAILSDDQQRATYDACLVNAQQQRAQSSKRNIFSGLRRLAPDVVSSVVIAVMSIGAFLLVEKVSTMRIAPAQVQRISVPVSALAAAMPVRPSDTVGRAADHSKLDPVPVAKEPAAPDAVKEIAEPVAAATADNTSAVSPTSDVVVKDARYYRERGGRAYRGGDLPLALIDFDLAINLDPNSAEAHADRAIVFRRMGNMKRALADVAEARRIDELRPQQTAPPSASN
jgi:tetratricopeptide (TPR) repeat protein